MYLKGLKKIRVFNSFVNVSTPKEYVAGLKTLIRWGHGTRWLFIWQVLIDHEYIPGAVDIRVLGIRGIHSLVGKENVDGL